jgi:hypothetical protein
VLELEVASREAAPGKGARYPSTSLVPVGPSRGVRQDMAHAGGRSQAKERLCEAAATLGISNRRKALYGGLFWKTKLMSVPGVELVRKQHHGELTSEPPRRHAIEIEIVYNMCRQTGPTAVSRSTILRNT